MVRMSEELREAIANFSEAATSLSAAGFALARYDDVSNEIMLAYVEFMKLTYEQSCTVIAHIQNEAAK